MAAKSQKWSTDTFEDAIGSSDSSRVQRYRSAQKEEREERRERRREKREGERKIYTQSLKWTSRAQMRSNEAD